jgi:gamma-glutamyltranspeptidase / glutathione hydrolase
VANVTQFQEEMLLASTAETIRSKISDEHTLPISAYNPNGIESLETPGTSEVVTADGSGMTISLTSTINLWFGSKIIVPETGLIMNNEMNDFSIPGASNAFGCIPSPANYIEPGKRPLSSMSPIIVDWLSSGKFYYALGGVGGSYIITAVAQSLWNVLDRNMTLQQALDAPRFHDQLIPNVIEFEYSYDNATVAFMAERGHNVTWAGRECDVMALRRFPNSTFEAASDPDFTAAGAYVV